MSTLKNGFSLISSLAVILALSVVVFSNSVLAEPIRLVNNVLVSVAPGGTQTPVDIWVNEVRMQKFQAVNGVIVATAEIREGGERSSESYLIGTYTPSGQVTLRPFSSNAGQLKRNSSFLSASFKLGEALPSIFNDTGALKGHIQSGRMDKVFENFLSAMVAGEQSFFRTINLNLSRNGKLSAEARELSLLILEHSFEHEVFKTSPNAEMVHGLLKLMSDDQILNKYLAPAMQQYLVILLFDALLVDESTEGIVQKNQSKKDIGSYLLKFNDAQSVETLSRCLAGLLEVNPDLTAAVQANIDRILPLIERHGNDVDPYGMRIASVVKGLKTSVKVLECVH